MKNNFTKQFSTALLFVFIASGFTVNAQQAVLVAVNNNKIEKVEKSDSTATAEKKTTTVVKSVKKAEDAGWVPVRRLWGYAFGDLYYAPHAEAANRGPETMYNGVPSNRNAFQFRRLYLGYDYDIDQRFTAEVLLASEPNANTGTVNGVPAIQNGDNLVNGRMAFWIKNFNLRYRNIWKGTDLVVGEMSTPGFALNEPGTNGPTSLAEATWGYRFIEKTITDFHKNNSYDIGAALQGTFDPATKNFGYVFMVGDNTTSNLTSATTANTGFYKIFYGDLWGKFLNKKLYVDIYADAAKTGAATAAVGPQEHNMFKIFAAYNTKPITVGVEAYTEQLTNVADNTTTKTIENGTVTGLSIWAKGSIVKDKMAWFARFDTYNPDTKFNSNDVYSPSFNTTYGNYTAFYKETFYTAGLDFTPAPKIHFSPNLWLINYKDQRSASTTGYVGPDHTLVLRATFFYTFGK